MDKEAKVLFKDYHKNNKDFNSTLSPEPEKFQDNYRFSRNNKPKKSN